MACKSGKLRCNASVCKDCGHVEIHNNSCRNCPNCQAVLKELWVVARRAEVIGAPYFQFLGAMPGIIQVLHTWRQELNFHPHIHCIVSGGDLSKDLKLKTCGNGFFIPAKVLAAKFRGKLLSSLNALYRDGKNCEESHSGQLYLS